MDAFKYLQAAWWDDSEKVWKKQHGWHPCLKGEEVGGKDCLEIRVVVFKNAAASQAHSLCWSNYVGVLGKKKAKQLEKGLAVGKPKLKDLEAAEQLSSPGRGHASHVCKSLEQLLGQSCAFWGAGQPSMCNKPTFASPWCKTPPCWGCPQSVWHCMRHRAAYFSQNLKAALVKGLSDYMRL